MEWKIGESRVNSNPPKPESILLPIRIETQACFKSGEKKKEKREKKGEEEGEGEGGPTWAAATASAAITIHLQVHLIFFRLFSSLSLSRSLFLFIRGKDQKESQQKGKKKKSWLGLGAKRVERRVRFFKRWFQPNHQTQINMHR